MCALDAPPEVKLSLPDWAQSYAFTGSLRPTLLSPYRPVPDHIRKPDYAHQPQGISAIEREDRARAQTIRVYTTEELDQEYGFRHTCRMGREVLDLAGRALRPGITTDEIDRIVHEGCLERDCYPSPLNYYQFPKSVCTSVNEVICHGIPDFREIQDGGKYNTVFISSSSSLSLFWRILLTSDCPGRCMPDIVNLDVTTYNRGGYHGDLNETFCVGNVDADGQRLVRTAFECLAAALELVRPGTLYRDLGTVIERKAKQNNCSVVRTYCGHGIGKDLFHTIPNIAHVRILIQNNQHCAPSYLGLCHRKRCQACHQTRHSLVSC